jgi:hypothetical protein
MVQVFGGHRVQAGDATAGLDTLMNGATAAVFYSDPPWGPGMMTYFQNLVRKQTGETPAQPDYLTLLRAVLYAAATFTDGPVFIEYGMQWADDVVRAASVAGCAHIATFDAVYTSTKRPLHVHLFAPPRADGALLAGVAASAAYRTAIASATGVAAVVAAIRPFVVPDGIVLDPCCGGGLVAKAAVRCGMRFYGNELNAHRLEPCTKWLRREVNA